MARVTDPELLAILNGESSPSKRVTDPELLAILNGESSPSKRVTDPALLAQLDAPEIEYEEPEAPSTLRIAAEAPAKAINTFSDQILNTPTRIANLGIAGIGSLATAAGHPEYAPDALPDPDWIRHFVGEGTEPVGAGQENLDKSLQFATLGALSPTHVLRNAVLSGVSGSAGDIVGRATDSPAAEFATNMVTPLAVMPAVKAAQWTGTKGANLLATMGAARGNQSGINRLAADAAQRAAGDAAPQIVRAAQTATEYVPGSKPTIGEAIAEQNMGQPQQFGGGVVKLQKELTGAQGVEDVLPSVTKQQDAAMLAPVQRMAGGTTRETQDAAQEGAKQARSQGSGKQYEAIAPNPVAIDGNLITLLTSSAGTQAMKIAQQIASNDSAARAASGKSPIPFFIQNKQGKITGFTAQGLQNVKSALDSMATNKTLQDMLGIAGSGKAAVGQVRNALVQWMNKKIPGWESARKQYASESLPINRLQVGQALTDKLKNEKGDLTPSSFMNVLGRGEDAMLKKSGGGARDVSIDTLFPAADAAHIKGVGADLARRAEMERIAGSTKGGQSRNLVSGEVPQLPNLLSREAMLINWLMRGAIGDANLPVAKELAKRAAEPKNFVELLKQRKPGMNVRDAAKVSGNVAPISALLIQQQ